MVLLKNCINPSPLQKAKKGDILFQKENTDRISQIAFGSSMWHNTSAH